MKKHQRQKHITEINDTLMSYGFELNKWGNFQRGSVRVDTRDVILKGKLGKRKIICRKPITSMSLDEIESLVARWHK